VVAAGVARDSVEYGSSWCAWRGVVNGAKPNVDPPPPFDPEGGGSDFSFGRVCGEPHFYPPQFSVDLLFSHQNEDLT